MPSESNPIEAAILAGPVNAYSTLRDAPPPDFPCRVLGRRDASVPDYTPQLKGFQGFIMRNGAMNARRYQLLQHIGRAQVQFAVAVEPAQLGALADWAARANAILLLADMSVRAPGGGLLWSPDAPDGEPDAEVPFPTDALARRRRSLETLAARGLASLPDLPPIVSEAEVRLRDPSEVALRVLALTAVALRGESFAHGPERSVEEIRKRLPLAASAFSPWEAEFMRGKSLFRPAPRPDRQAIVDATWRYEAAAPLWWALHAGADLPFPAAQADPVELVQAVMESDGAKLVAEARLRSSGEILDQLDLMYRLNWILDDCRMRETPPPEGVAAGVVRERHYALNWLVRFMDADWDEVQTPT